MIRQHDGTVLFTETEVKSLTRLVVACNNAISSMSNDGDFLGWDNYRALGMWEDKLTGKLGPLDDYVGKDEMRGVKTVSQWLGVYGGSTKGEE